jgi:serine/threonine protein kinase/tetratricopeptide (TPR) repeat protein
MDIDAPSGGLDPARRLDTTGADRGPRGAGHHAGARLERLGDYHILQELGRGGMGVVYEAERESLKVRVALKVMHPTFRTDATHLRRFHAEARSAARLHHTNIVPVFDYGEQDGICYYAMQMITGVGLNRVLDEVRRVRSSAGALAATRSGGPTAELVPIPDQLSYSLMTISQRLLCGGFAASPAAGSATDATALLPIDGALPLEPASARTPAGTGASVEADTNLSFSGSSLSGRSESAWHREIARLCAQVADALDHAHRQGVIHRDIKPSNLLLDDQGNAWVTDFGLAKLVEGEDLSQSHELVGTLRFMAPERFKGVTDRRGDLYALGATLYELLTLKPAFDERDPVRLIQQIGERPVTPPRQHDRRISRDLETIVLKTLAKDPKDRFATAGDLRDELRRFLEGRPIRSRPIGPAERAWRWCNRNRIVAGLLALVIGLCVTLAAGSTAAWLRLRGSYDQIQLERNHAEDNFREARRAVDDSFTRVSESALLNAPGMQPLRKQLLEDALKYYQGFVQRLGDRRGVQADLAAALHRVALITAEIGSKEEALGYEVKARSIFESLVAEEPGDARLRRELARSIAAVAHLRGEAGRREQAVVDYQQALALQRALADADTGDVLAQDDLAGSETKLGSLLRDLNRRDESLQCQERAIAIRERLALAHPDRPTYQHNLALVLGHVGILHNDAGRHDEASRAYRRAIAILQPVVAAHPEVAPYRFTLATTSHLLGVSQRRANRPDLALESYRKAQELHEALVVANPSVIDYRYELAGTLNNIANIHHSARRPEEALATHRKALEIRETLIVSDPRVVRYQSAIASSYNAIAMIQAQLGRREDALQTFQRFRDRMQAVLADDPRNVDARLWISSALHNLAETLVELGRPAEAVRPFLDAIEQKRVLITSGHGTKAVVRSLCNHYRGLAGAQRALGLPADAATTLRDHQELWAGDPDAFYEMACGLSLCIPLVGKGRNGSSLEQAAERRKYGDWAIDALRRAVAGGFRDAAHMSKDADLRPLHERADFRALVGDVGFPNDPF